MAQEKSAEKKILISVKDLYKTFRLPQEKHTSAKQAFLGIFKKKHFIEQKVLNGVSFEVLEGDFFGIVGRNGSGKSTLLKILAGIYTYDSGEVKINGKISPFLELGVGFNPELSGWENIYLNGALLGLEKSEIDAKIDEIIEFSELGDFMDQKLKNYSSGMQVRLAFSVAIHAHAPIILLDEVLAVGDSNFQRKCFDVFEKLKKEGRTIVFVTHSMDHVKKFCNKAILISKGKLVITGNPEKVAFEYEELNLQEINKKRIPVEGANKWGSGGISVGQIKIGSSEKNLQVGDVALTQGQDVFVGICLTSALKGEIDGIIELGLYNDKGKLFGSLHEITLLQGERRGIIFSLEGKSINPGKYFWSYNIRSKETDEIYYAESRAIRFEICGDGKFFGPCNLQHFWTID